jgi:hypothetical protein
VNSKAAWQNAAESLPPQPAQEKLTDVFEVYGGSAHERGWDFLVCKSIKDALAFIESDIDGLEDGEEVKIVFRTYTQSQMDEVIYE